VLGTQLGGDELKITAEEALRAYTIDSAWACHAEKSVGSIERGKFADFAIVSADPTAEGTDLDSLSVSETWIGGARAA
jgi:predicted amidohydrolase YtcJ